MFGVAFDLKEKAVQKEFEVNAVTACRWSFFAVLKLFTCKHCCHSTYTFLLAVNPLTVKHLELLKKASKWWALLNILVTFLGVTEHFSGTNGELRWSILVGKTKA